MGILVIASFIIPIYASKKAADFHYKSYRGDVPLYFAYGLSFVAAYSLVVIKFI